MPQSNERGHEVIDKTDFPRDFKVSLRATDMIDVVFIHVSFRYENKANDAENLLSSKINSLYW